MAFSSRPRKSPFARNRVHPLLLATIIVVGGLALYFLISFLFFGEGGTVVEARLNVPSGDPVYVQTADDPTDLRPVSATTLSLLENEAVESRNANDSTVEFFENSQIALDAQTKLALLKSRRHSGEAREIGVKLEKGQIWGEVSPSLNPRSEFKVDLGNNIFLTTKNGNFSVNTADGKIKVAKGTVRLSQLESEKEVFFQDIGVGQEFAFTGNLSGNVLAILTDDPWFDVHRDGEIPVGEVPETPSGSTSGTATGTGSSVSTKAAIEILVPGKDGSNVNVSADTQEISGTVPEDTASVVVNDYTLQKFKAGQDEFSYVTGVKLGNLKEGKNEYEIQALDVDKKLLDSATITLVYTPAADSDEDSDQTGETPAKVTGTFAITGPNGGKDFVASDAKGVDLLGTAPSNASKIVVNGYALSKFTLGDVTWSYKIRTEFGNLKPGANTYEVKALDAQGKVLGTKSITITFPETSTTPPEPETPTDSEKTTDTSTPSETSGTVSTGTTPSSENP